MQNENIDDSGDDPVILAAIDYAQQNAGKSNKDFVRALLGQVQGGGGGPRRTLRGGAP